MLPLRTARTVARRLRPQNLTSRRQASDSHGSHSHDSHGPANESYGAGFYICISAIPLSLAVYKFTGQGTSEKPYFTRLIQDTYADYKTQWAQRNDLHTQAMEQAAADRSLFIHEANNTTRHVDLRYPEQFNHGSPWNVPAGQGSANLDVLIAKYEKEAFAAQEEKLQQLRENRVPAEQPVPDYLKVTPAAADSGS
ncbi:related to NADH-ubiquinone oxidoreductase 17.8 kDa subunit [Ramularia collo-cygni]|uniref:Related to NADH-ubiquinone oxidoreductase 17.8 kDa subunit n=1 Tax=Ramularia collo-cygni TaxID=112498 RepID=A0A2D3V194_9PEZI|nr:related to NADH-ubiquinone oxidoreductase 17.8 kDa subunit [Ramularia collo-cygni]CZT17296.1 related to NADH-ubiquinone oxidoreductase 17.8 kDa subunit [Ramularia collo-cygni]